MKSITLKYEDLPFKPFKPTNIKDKPILDRIDSGIRTFIEQSKIVARWIRVHYGQRMREMSAEIDNLPLMVIFVGKSERDRLKIYLRSRGYIDQ